MTDIAAQPNARPGQTGRLPIHQEPVESRQASCAIDLATSPVQLTLPGYEGTVVRRSRRHAGGRDGHRSNRDVPKDPLIETYLRRLAALGAAEKGYEAYRYQLGVVRLLAERRSMRPVAMVDLFRDPELLGQVLVDDVAPSDGSQLSKWTLAQRRSAIRSFATLMGPELNGLIGGQVQTALDEALRSVAIRIGGGYQLTGGAPRKRGGEVPSHGDIASVLGALKALPGYGGVRAACFFSILYTSGARVNALRTLDGANCVEMPSGRIRLFLHEKGGHELREVELPHELSDRLRTYAAAFNAHAARHRWSARIGIGRPGALWRNSPRGHWSYDHVRQTLARACRSVGVTPFRPHAFRRALATEAASVYPRHVVAQAGGWRGLERLDNHYIRANPQHVTDKLDRAGQHAEPPLDKEAPDGANSPLQVGRYVDSLGSEPRSAR